MKVDTHSKSLSHAWPGQTSLDVSVQKENVLLHFSTLYHRGSSAKHSCIFLLHRLKAVFTKLTNDVLITALRPSTNGLHMLVIFFKGLIAYLFVAITLYLTALKTKPHF